MKILVAVFIALGFLSTSFAKDGESPFPPISEKTREDLRKLIADWADHKDEGQMENETRNSMKMAGALGTRMTRPSVRALPGFNRTKLTGTVEVVTSHPIPRTYRYHYESAGELKSIELVETGDNGEKKVPLFSANTGVLAAGVNSLLEDTIEYCNMIKKPGQMPKEIPVRIARNNDWSVEKAIREALDHNDSKAVKKLLESNEQVDESSESFKKFEELVLRNLKKADVNVINPELKASDIISVTQLEDVHQGWVRTKTVKHNYIQINLPQTRRKYVFAHNELGVVTSVPDFENGGVRDIVFSDAETTCIGGDLKKTYAALTGATGTGTASPANTSK